MQEYEFPSTVSSQNPPVLTRVHIFSAKYFWLTSVEEYILGTSHFSLNPLLFFELFIIFIKSELKMIYNECCHTWFWSFPSNEILTGKRWHFAFYFIFTSCEEFSNKAFTQKIYSLNEIKQLKLNIFCLMLWHYICKQLLQRINLLSNSISVILSWTIMWNNIHICQFKKHTWFFM